MTVGEGRRGPRTRRGATMRAWLVLVGHGDVGGGGGAGSSTAMPTLMVSAWLAAAGDGRALAALPTSGVGASRGPGADGGARPAVDRWRRTGPGAACTLARPDRRRGSVGCARGWAISIPPSGTSVPLSQRDPDAGWGLARRMARSVSALVVLVVSMAMATDRPAFSCHAVGVEELLVGDEGGDELARPIVLGAGEGGLPDAGVAASLSSRCFAPLRSAEGRCAASLSHQWAKTPPWLMGGAWLWMATIRHGCVVRRHARRYWGGGHGGSSRATSPAWLARVRVGGGGEYLATRSVSQLGLGGEHGWWLCRGSQPLRPGRPGTAQCLGELVVVVLCLVGPMMMTSGGVGVVMAATVRLWFRSGTGWDPGRAPAADPRRILRRRQPAGRLAAMVACSCRLAMSWSSARATERLMARPSGHTVDSSATTSTAVCWSSS